jgi:hypothetical protein
MSWLLPSALVIAGIAALGVIALHFISRSRPLAEPLPTARFIPQRPVQARARATALSDVLLLLLRLAAILALGLAVAGPMFAAGRGRVARVVLLDRSRAVANFGAARDSARSLLRQGDVLVVFDSAARAVPSRALDTHHASTARGSLSAGLVAAIRAAAALAPRADSIALVVITPLAAEEVDGATSRIRASWSGAVHTMLVANAAPSERPLPVESSSAATDPVVAGLALRGIVSSSNSNAAGPMIRLVRQRVTAADSAWGLDSGHVLIHWPMADSTAIWPKRPTIDAIGGVVSDGGTLVGRFPRLWSIQGTTIARWADGAPAAVEHATGAGCIRDIGLLVDPGSDLTLRPAFQRFVMPLLAPCGGFRHTARADSATLAAFDAPGALALAAAFRDRGNESSRYTPWLLALGALLLIVELAVRRPERGSAARAARA